MSTPGDQMRPSELDGALREGPGPERPDTLDEALGLTGASDDAAFWGDPAPVVVPPEPSPEVAPGPPVETPGERPVGSRRERRRARQEAKEAERSTRLAKRRHRILPRTVIGISAMLVALAIGAAVSGAVLYAYYDWRLTENEDRVGTLATSLEKRLTRANEDISASQTAAVNEIRTAAEPLAQILADTKTVGSLTPAMAPSVWFVETLDDKGAPSVGSAFVVASDAGQSLLVTSYSVVAASTTEPGPAITLVNGDDEITAELFNWQPEKDLALLTVTRPDLEPLEWADDDQRAKAVGRQAYAVSGLGGRGASLSPGLVIDQSTAGLQHTAVLGTHFRGGPVVSTKGRVLAVASLDYEPLNFDPGDLRFAIPIDQTCERVLTCTGSTPEAS